MLNFILKPLIEIKILKKFLAMKKIFKNRAHRMRVVKKIDDFRNLTPLGDAVVDFLTQSRKTNHFSTI